MSREVGKLVVLLLGLSAAAGSVQAEETASLSPREIVERCGGAVVMIDAESDGDIGQGSGFLVGADGVIVTNLHVVDGASKLVITFRDGTRTAEVAVRAFDVERDLAVLVVDPPGSEAKLPTVEFGDTSSIEPGARILVIGNPLGLEQTVTEGIVSAWREPREPAAPPPEGARPSKLLLPPSRLLQISAAISPGSSGGPVFNERAEVIGVATAGVLYGAAGLNFAVPIDELPSLIAEDDAMDLVTLRARVDDVRLEMARPHFERAELAYERGERSGARQHVERALQLFPRYEEALLLSGRIALETGQTELAEQRFTEAVKVNEHSAEAWFRLGQLYHLTADRGDDAALLSRAEAAYERSLEIDARHARAAFHLAVIEAHRGSLDRAEELLVAALDAEPRFTDAHYMLGEIYLGSGQIDQAKQAFERALWEDEDHALSHFGLAKLYTTTDLTPHGTVSQHGPAPHHWERFLELSEGDPSLAKQRELAIRFVREHFPHLLER